MRIRSIGFVVAISLAGVFVACATAGQRAGTSGQQSPKSSAPASAASGRETFSAEQLASTAAANVYDALNMLRPEVITGRGRGAPDVYVGAVKQPSGLDRLKELALSAVSEVTYLRYDQARSLADAQSSGGAVVVTLR